MGPPTLVPLYVQIRTMTPKNGCYPIQGSKPGKIQDGYHFIGTLQTAMKYKLVDLEWWFWCPNEGLLTQEFTSRQQKTCMSNFQWPNPRWPPFYRNIAKIAMKQELIDLEWWFWCSNVGILGKGFTSRQQKTCMSNIQGPNPRWPPFYISRSNG